MLKTEKHPKWVTKNAGPEAVGKVRHWLGRAPLTDLDLVAFTGLSRSAVQAARFALGCVDAGLGHKPDGQPGRAPTKWALPEVKR